MRHALNAIIITQCYLKTTSPLAIATGFKPIAIDGFETMGLARRFCGGVAKFDSNPGQCVGKVSRIRILL